MAGPKPAPCSKTPNVRSGATLVLLGKGIGGFPDEGSQRVRRLSNLFYFFTGKNEASHSNVQWCP